MFDFTGTKFDFSVTEGLAERMVLRFGKSGTAEKLDLSGATWQFRARNAGSGDEVDGLSVEHGAETGELVLMIPGLTAGEYGYELFATDSTGGINRVCYGVFTAITSAHGSLMVQAARKESARTLDVFVPAVNGAKLELRWTSCSVAETAAAQAIGIVAGARDEADRAKLEADRAAREADRAGVAADDISTQLTNLVNRADEAVGKVENMEGRLNAIDDHIRDSIVPNAATNTWWIAGNDSHYRVTGEPGQSPYLDDDGFWWAFDDGVGEFVNTGINARGEDGRCPIIGSNGNWLHWNQKDKVWEDSGVQARGKDGINGSTVRRIIVDRVADIPAEGETCNGGVYYYIPLVDAQPVAIINVLDTEAGGFTVNGTTVTYTAQEDRESAAGAVATGLRTALATLPGLTVETEGSRVIMTADIAGWTFEALDTERYTLEEHVRMQPQKRYDVYAWLEQQDGTSGWVCVGEANDIATAEIYGLVKTATDVVVRDGAPVGNNENGQMAVPMARENTSGSVRISFPDSLGEGGRIGFDMDKRLRGEPATHQLYGDVRLSYRGNDMTNGEADGTIGLRADGSIGVRWATLREPGVIRLGSEFGQLNRTPYQQGVGATPNHEIANNILFRGAIKHQKLSGWKSQSHMPWLDTLDETITGDERKYLNEHDFYLGLHTSLQFEQSEETGLVLLPATTGRIAGVYLALSMDDTRPEAVPNANTTKTWSLLNHYTKAETYSKTEIDAALEGKASLAEMEEYKRSVNQAITAHNQSVSQTLNTYDSYIRTQLFTKTEFDTAKQEFMTRTKEWHGSVVMTENNYNGLEAVDSKMMYFLIEEE